MGRSSVKGRQMGREKISVLSRIRTEIPGTFQRMLYVLKLIK